LLAGLILLADVTPSRPESYAGTLSRTPLGRSASPSATSTWQRPSVTRITKRPGRNAKRWKDPSMCRHLRRQLKLSRCFRFHLARRQPPVNRPLPPPPQSLPLNPLHLPAPLISAHLRSFNLMQLRQPDPLSRLSLNSSHRLPLPVSHNAPPLSQLTLAERALLPRRVTSLLPIRSLFQ
jgi:hypothetical protein